MYKSFKGISKISSYLFFLIFLSGIGYALEGCLPIVTNEDIPCLVFLQFNESPLICGNYSINIYKESSFLYSNTLDNYTSFLCSGIFNETELGTYNGQWSTGDVMTIVVTEGITMILIYFLAIAFFLAILIFGLWKMDINFTALSAIGFLTIGLIITMSGISIYNNLLTKTLGAVLIGIGAYVFGKCLEGWFKF